MKVIAINGSQRPLGNCSNIINEMQDRFDVRTFAPEDIAKREQLTYVTGLARHLMDAFRDPSLTIGGAYER